MRVAASLLAVIACGGPPSPGVRAWVTGEGVEVRWDATPFAPTHAVRLADLDRGAPVSPALVVRGDRARLTGRSSGVWVDALPGGRAVGVVSSGAEGGDGSAWQIFAPWDFRGGALQATFARLSPDERLAVLLVNFGGQDGAPAEVAIEGAAAAAEPPPSLRAALTAGARPDPDRPLPRLHEALRARESRLALERPAAPESLDAGARGSFCVVPGLDFSRHLRKPATLALSTAHAEIYLDDDDLDEYEGPDLAPLGAAIEDGVWPAVTGTFGALPDVDGNGKLLVLISHELGARLNGGWLIGYFGNADLLRARDGSADCSGSGSNHAEIVYLNDVRNGQANGYAKADLLSRGYPATIAHELQHLLNFARRCVMRSCERPEETWINEALSKIAEDLAGFGWNESGGRAEGAAYLGRGGGELRGYDGRSLTQWEGDPIGNYQGVHSFLRLFTDRAGAALAGRIASGAGGETGVESALGLPLPLAMAEWATALLLSNEPGAPYSFDGAPWSPLHERLRHLDTRPPGPLTLRHDGIAAVLSGPGLDAAARVVVRSAGDPPPYVVVARAGASLPER